MFCCAQSLPLEHTENVELSSCSLFNAEHQKFRNVRDSSFLAAFWQIEK